ncbi:hypothetical protein HXX76_011822 [Chlamydomonas incerta]|uniref:Uncharacterized protein n=1 Tax=Chlamydomonas incerta TaxID=51695 RepID=A0A835VSZ2_CHLIN|nr:hypothetical protein HXX76_011822 [Chlamydomonas incerta]|eukprot:KAG2428142.1 hypothetical protein HXX76_011822 [Chlamydomonas incerta]
MFKSFYDRGTSPSVYSTFETNICNLTLTEDLFPTLPVAEHLAFQQVVSQLAPSLKSTRWPNTTAFLDYWAQTGDVATTSAAAMTGFPPYARVRAYMLSACLGLSTAVLPPSGILLSNYDFELTGTVLSRMEASGLQLTRTSPVGANPFTMTMKFDPTAVSEPASLIKITEPSLTAVANTLSCTYTNADTGELAEWEADRSITLLPDSSAYRVSCRIANSQFNNGRATSISLDFYILSSDNDGSLGYAVTLFHGLPFPPPPPSPPSPPPPPPSPSPPPPPRPPSPPPPPPPTCESSLRGQPCYKLHSLEGAAASLDHDIRAVLCVWLPHWWIS